MRDELQCSRSHKYQVQIDHGLHLGRVSGIQNTIHEPSLLVSTPTVWDLYGRTIHDALVSQGIEVSSLVLQLSESSKNLDSFQRICSEAYSVGLGRRSTIISLGGGVCSDLVAFSASVIRRGVSYIKIPTTLMGQIDAGLGIKGGVNFGSSKNYLGCFYPPDHVVCDPGFLKSLSDRHIIQGLAEIIKIAVVRDALLFRSIERFGLEMVESRFQGPADAVLPVLTRSIALMLEELQEDPFEGGSLRRQVDMGHTFSPAIEAASGYTIPHGEAVSIDLAFSTLLGLHTGICQDDVAERLIQLLKNVGLPIWSNLLTPELCRHAHESAVLHRNGQLNLVIPQVIGSGMFVAAWSSIGEVAVNGALKQLEYLSSGYSPRYPLVS